MSTQKSLFFFLFALINLVALALGQEEILGECFSQFTVGQNNLNHQHELSFARAQDEYYLVYISQVTQKLRRASFCMLFFFSFRPMLFFYIDREYFRTFWGKIEQGRKYNHANPRAALSTIGKSGK